MRISRFYVVNNVFFSPCPKCVKMFDLRLNILFTLKTRTFLGISRVDNFLYMFKISQCQVELSANCPNYSNSPFCPFEWYLESWIQKIIIKIFPRTSYQRLSRLDFSKENDLFLILGTCPEFKTYPFSTLRHFRG